MDPESTLRRLSRQHRVPWERAKRLAPLVRRAAAAPPELQRSLLGVVEATLAREGTEIVRREQRERLALIAIANALHAWPDS